ncbi:MAG: TRAP transporter small permease [Planctomycetes bacterium]|nr:TRAP transporter small permease [Planctomycetota bacterium]
MRTLQRWIDVTTTVASAGIIAVYMIIVIYNVGSRYLFGGGIQWYMESSQFLNIWAMFIAGIGLCASNEHLRVSIIDDMLPGRWKRYDRILVSILTFAFYAFVAYATYRLAGRARQTISTMEPLKMSLVYWLLPFAAGASALAVVVDLLVYLTDGATVTDGQGEGATVSDGESQGPTLTNGENP